MGEPLGVTPAHFEVVADAITLVGAGGQLLVSAPSLFTELREACAEVSRRARWVRIDDEALDKLTSLLARERPAAPALDPAHRGFFGPGDDDRLRPDNQCDQLRLRLVPPARQARRPVRLSDDRDRSARALREEGPLDRRPADPAAN